MALGPGGGGGGGGAAAMEGVLYKWTNYLSGEPPAGPGAGWGARGEPGGAGGTRSGALGAFKWLWGRLMGLIMGLIMGLTALLRLGSWGECWGCLSGHGLGFCSPQIGDGGWGHLPCLAAESPPWCIKGWGCSVPFAPCL